MLLHICISWSVSNTNQVQLIYIQRKETHYEKENHREAQENNTQEETKG